MDTTVCTTLSVVHECVTATHHGIAPVRQSASSAIDQYANMLIRLFNNYLILDYGLWISSMDSCVTCVNVLTCLQPNKNITIK